MLTKGFKNKKETFRSLERLMRMGVVGNNRKVYEISIKIIKIIIRNRKT